MSEKPTFVVFRILEGEVIALFPEELGTNDPWTMNSYMSNGGHGSASQDLVYGTRLATEAEYAPLKQELERIGYKLDVRKRLTRHNLEAREKELELQKFIGYVYQFYGPGGVYPMEATMQQIREATEILLFRVFQPNSGIIIDFDSLDRERVRDIMIEEFGLVFPKPVVT
jgi:hypothetical protein